MKLSFRSLTALLAATILCGGQPALAHLSPNTAPSVSPVHSRMDARSSDPGGDSAQMAAPSGPCTLIIHVDGFRSQKGDAGISLFTSADGWPENNDKAFFHGPNPFSGASATITLHVPTGRYAIAALADTNGDHHMDRNIFGIPKKGFGFSNNPKVFLTAPSFDKAALPVVCPVTQTTIHLLYR